MQVMRKSFGYIALLAGLFLFGGSFSYARDEKFKVRQKIKRIARKISHYRTVDFGLVGFSPEITKQSERYLTLSKEATDTELVVLTDHKSAKVRVYAFDILVGRKYKDIKTILEKHIDDTVFFTSRSGCMVMKDRVNLHCLSRLTPVTGRERDFVLSAEEADYFREKIHAAIKQRR